MAQLLEQVRHRLQSNFIKVDPEWLSECVEYFVEQSPSISVGDLYDQTFEQWKLSDIAEVGLACLPAATIAGAKDQLVTLTGQYVLQMQFVIDIAEPAYDQLRRLYNKKLDQTEAESTESKKLETRKKRSLKLELTDGHTTIAAMEYSPIACLHTKMLPGCKLLLTGPLRCINRVILLEPGSVRVLGGEVTKFEVDNAFENVLLRALGRPPNPNPKTEYIEQPVVEEPRRTQHDLAALQAQHRLSQVEKANAVNDSADIFGDDDDLLLDLMENDFSSIPSSPQPPSRRPTKPITARPPPADDLHIDLLDDDDDFDEILDTLPTVSLQNQFPDDENESNRRDVIDEDAEEIERMCYEENLRQKPPPETPKPKSITDADYPFKIRGCNLVTIAQLNALAPPAAKLDRTFMIKGELQNVFDKLQIKRSHWTIGVDAGDASGETMRLRFGDAVLNKLTGSSAAEVSEMRKRANSMPQLSENITELLNNLKATMQNINCFLKVQFVRDEVTGDVSDTANGLEIIESAPFLEQILARQMRDAAVR